MKKIGIVTIQGRFNYGNRLQNYATSVIYKNFGCRPVSLFLDRPLPPMQRAKQTVNRMLGKIEAPRELSMTQERLSAFDSFNSCMEFKTVHALSQGDLNEFDLFSVGSDQIWFMSRNVYGEDWRFLQFAQPEQRVALAPSFGTDSLSDAQMRRLSRYLRGFRSISVREESGAHLIKEATGREATVVCDPTLVLGADEWDAVSNDRLTPMKNYVFAYLLGRDSDEAKRALDIASRHGALPIIFLSDHEDEGELPAGPAEFLSLIENAEWVVTDSFHGSALSSIFQKPLTIVHRGGGKAMYSKMFGRLETLSSKLGIKHKIYGSSEFDPSRADDYEGVPEAIENERRIFLRYLEGCLNA